MYQIMSSRLDESMVFSKDGFSRFPDSVEVMSKIQHTNVFHM